MPSSKNFSLIMQAARGEAPVKENSAGLQSTLDDWFNKNFPSGLYAGQSNPVDPMGLINPIYTRQQGGGGDPLQMYRDFKSSGALPTSQPFQPYTQPQMDAPVSQVSRPVLSQSPQGGK